MSKQILTILKKKLDDLSAYGELDAETRRNALKEELQFYILNFIYHHPKYSTWIMYGGSALRIIHGLDRMSVDLDFEVSHDITKKILAELKNELESYFENTYNADANFLTIKITTGRGLLLKFHVGEALGFDHPSQQVHVKIDLNHFATPKTVTERRPINRDQLSFVIVTYNMAALMASKIAAIFLRGTRGVGKAVYEEKGRDIYDLIWYMNKKIVPDLDYLVAKHIDVTDLRAVFDKLTLQMNRVSDENLKQDLTPLFTNRMYVENWLQSWRESYLRLLDDYKIYTVTELEHIRIHHDVIPDIFYFNYVYKTQEGHRTHIVYAMSDYWIEFSDEKFPTEKDKKIADLIEFTSNGFPNNPPKDKLKQYATLFYQKTENYFKNNNRIMLGNKIETKFIRMTANNLNPEEEIVLNKSALLSSKLDDLLK